ncbi:hypothetical protein L7F22_048592 [Adiantum nelumboides]|nr:hypothetical protein [Adiantum nelumboides]
MRYLLRHASEHRRLLATCLLLALLGSAAGLAQPLAAQAVIDALGRGGALLTPVLLLSLLVVGSAIAQGVDAYLLDRTGEHMVLRIRRELAAHLVRLRIPVLDARSPGDLVTRATSDTGLVRHAATTAPVHLVNGAVGIVGALVLMAVLDVRLFLVTVVVLVVVGAPAALVLPRIRRASEDAQTAVGAVGSSLDRALGAARTVKAHGAEQREQAVIDAASGRAFRAGVVQARWEAVMLAGAELALQVSFLVVLAVGGGLVATGSMTVATLVAFLLYLFYLANPLTELTTAVGSVQQGLGAARRLAEVETLPVEDGVDPQAAPARPALAPPPPRWCSTTSASPTRDGPRSCAGCGSPCRRVPCRARGSVGGGQVDGARPAAALPRAHRWVRPPGRNRPGDDPPLRAARADRARRAGLARPRRDPAREPAARRPAGDGRRARRGPPAHPAHEAGRPAAPGARHPGRSARGHPVRRRASAGHDRPRAAASSGAAPARRGDRAPRQRHGGGTARGARRRSTGSTVIVVAHRLRTVRDADAIVVLDAGRVRTVGTHEELVTTDELYRSLAAAQSTAPRRDVLGTVPPPS